MANQAATPSTAARSRASTAVLESSDRGTPTPNHPQLTMTPPTSTLAASLKSGESGSIDSFNPYQSVTHSLLVPSYLLLNRALMETEITFHYGKNLKRSRVLHQEMLCCHSGAARDLFEKAKPLRNMYTKANNLRKTLKELIYTQDSGNASDEGAARNQVGPSYRLVTILSTVQLHISSS